MSARRVCPTCAQEEGAETERDKLAAENERLRAELTNLGSAAQEVRERRKGCDHCESTVDELAKIIEEARLAVAPVIEAELEGERRAKEIMDMRLK